MKKSFSNHKLLWKLGTLVTNDLFSPEKVYLIHKNAPRWRTCDCGKTEYEITTEILYELEGVHLVKVDERDIEKEVGR